MNYGDLRTIQQKVDENPGISISTVRWWVFNAKENGLDRAIVKIGGRVYIDNKRFDEWVESQRLVDLEEA